MEEEKTRIYRFKVQNMILFEEMKEFANTHKFESKDVLKESFESWYISDEINNLIEEEETYLTRHCYDFKHNNMKTKIFKSIKYYFIKNMLSSMRFGDDNNVEKDKKRTKHVLKFSHKFIEQVKNYIKSSMENSNFTPKSSYCNFIESCENIIDEEKKNLLETFDAENIANNFENKMKKMFKNQYYSMNKNS